MLKNKQLITTIWISTGLMVTMLNNMFSQAYRQITIGFHMNSEIYQDMKIGSVLHYLKP